MRFSPVCGVAGQLGKRSASGGPLWFKEYSLDFTS